MKSIFYIFHNLISVIKSHMDYKDISISLLLFLVRIIFFCHCRFLHSMKITSCAWCGPFTRGLDHCHRYWQGLIPVGAGRCWTERHEVTNTQAGISLWLWRRIGSCKSLNSLLWKGGRLESHHWSDCESEQGIDGAWHLWKKNFFFYIDNQALVSLQLEIMNLAKNVYDHLFHKCLFNSVYFDRGWVRLQIIRDRTRIPMLTCWFNPQELHTQRHRIKGEACLYHIRDDAPIYSCISSCHNILVYWYHASY